MAHIRKLIDCLVNIEDDSGEFLMTLPDGRVIDTKGWNDWEVRVLRAILFSTPLTSPCSGPMELVRDFKEPSC